MEGLAFAHSACHERARLTLLLPYSCSFAHSASTTRTVSVSSLGLRRGLDLAGVGAYGRRLATASLYSSARRPRSAEALAACLVPFYLPASFFAVHADFLPLSTLVGQSGAASMSVWSYGSEVNALGRRSDLMEAEASALAVTQLPPRLLRSIAPKAFGLVAAGGAHALAVGVDGAVYAWGWNQYGQCGLGAERVGSTVPLPTAVPFLQTRRAVQAYHHVRNMAGMAGPRGQLEEARGSP